MNRKHFVAAVFAAAVGATAILSVACSRESTDKTKVQYVSSDAKPPEAQFKPAEPAPRVLFSYGEGDCAPKFSDGTKGTCINNRPCNGFGFKGSKGELSCGCFAVEGGCPVDLRCSRTAQKCLPPKDVWEP